MPKLVPKGSPKMWHLRRRGNRHILKAMLSVILQYASGIIHLTQLLTTARKRGDKSRERGAHTDASRSCGKVLRSNSPGLQ